MSVIRMICLIVLIWNTYVVFTLYLRLSRKKLDCMGCCQNVSINQNELLGDSSEKALVEYVMQSKSIPQIQCEYIKVDEIPFDSIRKKMTTIHQKNNDKYVFTKGSIESILKQCTHILCHCSICGIYSIKARVATLNLIKTYDVGCRL